MRRVDSKLENKINQALLEDRRTGYERIRVSVQENSIILTGSVKNSKTRQTAEHIVRQVGGGCAIVNRLRIKENACFALGGSPTHCRDL